MRSRVFRSASLLMLGCLTAVTVAESIPSQGPAGWHWTGDGLVFLVPEGVYAGDWDDPDNWDFEGSFVPLHQYPQMENDDAYLEWDNAADLIVYLSTETIDFLEVTLAQQRTATITFDGGGAPGETLSCDHIRLRAQAGATLTFVVADAATLETVD